MRWRALSYSAAKATAQPYAQGPTLKTCLILGKAASQCAVASPVAIRSEGDSPIAHPRPHAPGKAVGEAAEVGRAVGKAQAY